MSVGVIDNIGGGIVPEGTKSITENGTYDVSEYANAEVAVSAGDVAYISNTSAAGSGTGGMSAALTTSQAYNLVYIMVFASCAVNENNTSSIAGISCSATNSVSVTKLMSSDSYISNNYDGKQPCSVKGRGNLFVAKDVPSGTKFTASVSSKRYWGNISISLFGA